MDHSKRLKSLVDIPLLDRRPFSTHHDPGSKDNGLPFEMPFQNPTAMFDAPYSIYSLDRQEKYIVGIHPPAFNAHTSQREFEYMRCAQQNVSMSTDYNREISIMLSHGAGQFSGQFPQFSSQPDGKQQMLYEQMMRGQAGPIMHLPDQFQLQASHQQTQIPLDRYDLMPFCALQILKSPVYLKN